MNFGWMKIIACFLYGQTFWMFRRRRGMSPLLLKCKY